MPSMVHAPLFNPGYFKDKTGEHLASAFTAVNGRNSPPSPPRLNGINGMIPNNTQPRPVSRDSPERQQAPKPREPARDNWSPPHPVAEAVHRNGHDSSSSPTLSDQDRSPLSPGKRKRAHSSEGARSHPSPDGVPVQRRRLDSHAPTGGRDSPNTITQVQQLVMEHPQPRTLPPVDRIETERPWVSSHEASYNGYHESQPQRRDLLRTTELDSNHESMSQAKMSEVDGPNGFEPSSTTRTTAAGVQVDPKKRKRQFANRTKTGCGTCRRRKKKCDEAKPECNNCGRGGFLCEGYAIKVPWPKNGTPKSHAPIVSKDRFPADPTQLYHSHGAPRESYNDSTSPNGTDGGRGRPIIVEDDRSAARVWASGWGDAPRPAYSQEQQPHAEYAHAPPHSSYGRTSANEQHGPHSTPAPPLPRHHTPRHYHHTQETMADKFSKATTAMNEAPPSQQSMMVSHPAGPPGPPPPHYAPPPTRYEKTEKQKMMDEEPFHPFDRELEAEREKCQRAVYAFNNTRNNNLTISDGEVDRNLRTILSANWNHPLRSGGSTGHLGKSVHVDPPFMCDYGYNIHIGSNVHIKTGCKLLDSGDITIGDDTTIGANVTIDTVKEPTDMKSFQGSGPNATSVAAKVHIGRNVHIGPGCIIAAGVHIGENAKVLAGSVVFRVSDELGVLGSCS
ncbi:hypothetical protein BU23DRAFT_566151 [Bimuria novae-zelandiae CBS 107.79]|uniref:Zn(2)-C6 fungal-type domain-containing protein n=1 Tax=Bimuria novae-zelandiae CBS 107.79 TaxID=1447943 RepID=A0A6A5VEM2_9PLEO|nr:hypothetical protein BU23DRAFT_566151 [Bimuria novae-zelandiae CBS 107.79]